MKYNQYADGKWFEPIIPEGATVTVGVRDFNGVVSFITIPVTQDILAPSGPTKEGRYHSVSLRLLGRKLPSCKSYFIQN